MVVIEFKSQAGHWQRIPLDILILAELFASKKKLIAVELFWM